jgi:hypothetical protein
VNWDRHLSSAEWAIERGPGSCFAWWFEVFRLADRVN